MGFIDKDVIDAAIQFETHPCRHLWVFQKLAGFFDQVVVIQKGVTGFEIAEPTDQGLGDVQRVGSGRVKLHGAQTVGDAAHPVALVFQQVDERGVGCA